MNTNFLVECCKCHHKYTSKGEEDWQSVGDGGPAACTGVELENPICPECGSDEVQTVDYAD